eukprot:g1760.t1
MFFPRKGLQISPKHMPVQGSPDPNGEQLLWRQHCKVVAGAKLRSSIMQQVCSPLVAEPHHQSNYRDCPVDREIVLDKVRRQSNTIAADDGRDALQQLLDSPQPSSKSPGTPSPTRVPRLPLASATAASASIDESVSVRSSASSMSQSGPRSESERGSESASGSEGGRGRHGGRRGRALAHVRRMVERESAAFQQQARAILGSLRTEVEAERERRMQAEQRLARMSKRLARYPYAQSRQLAAEAAVDA